MSALLDSFATAFSGNAEQRALLDAALRDGLPGPRSERWKYTSLRALERRSFATADAAQTVDAALLADIPAPRLVFVNGRADAGLSRLEALPAGAKDALGPWRDRAERRAKIDREIARIRAQALQELSQLARSGG